MTCPRQYKIISSDDFNCHESKSLLLGSKVIRAGQQVREEGCRL
jgi:hypothetical protein